MSFDVRAIVESHPRIQQLSLREREAAISVLEGALETITPVVRGLVAERDRYREALQRIAEMPFSPEPGWRHWRLIAATALREDAAPPSRSGPSEQLPLAAAPSSKNRPSTEDR